MSDPADPAPIRYPAFISYSHRDEASARRLHRQLETYRIPSRLVGTITPAGPVPRRLAPIFRDRDELPASANLTLAVQQALSQSDGLLVLCSPAARASMWVAAEIEYFRESHPDRPIVAALLEGEPAESFPPALRPAGMSGLAGEPVAADFRKGNDGARLARLKIIAGMTGLPLDALIQRDAQRQLRRVIFITLGALLFALSMALLFIFAIVARRDAEHQRQQAEGLIEFMLTDLRSKLEGVGRLDILDTVNDRALAYYGEQKDLSALPLESLERRARILHAMGEDDQKRGAENTALAKFREAHRVTGALLSANPDDPERIFAHAQSEFWLGYTDFVHSRFDKAEPRFLAYRDLAARMVELRPDETRYLRELGYAEGNLCTIAIYRRASQSFSFCSSAQRTMQRIAAANPHDPKVRVDLANRHAWMADAEHLLGRGEQALAERRKQMAIIDGLLAEDPKNASYRQDWMLARLSTAELLRALGQADKADLLLEECRRVAAELIAADPDNNDWRLWRDRIDRSSGDQEKRP